MVIMLIVTSPAFADRASDFREAKRREDIAAQMINSPGGGCKGMRLAIKADEDLAAIYRRCEPGLPGEEKAAKHESDANGIRDKNGVFSGAAIGRSQWAAERGLVQQPWDRLV